MGGGAVVGSGQPGELRFFRVIDILCDQCGFVKRTFRDLETGVSLNLIKQCPTCGTKLRIIKSGESTMVKVRIQFTEEGARNSILEKVIEANSVNEALDIFDLNRAGKFRGWQRINYEVLK